MWKRTSYTWPGLQYKIMGSVSSRFVYSLTSSWLLWRKYFGLIFKKYCQTSREFLICVCVRACVWACSGYIWGHRFTGCPQPCVPMEVRWPPLSLSSIAISSCDGLSWNHMLSILQTELLGYACWCPLKEATPGLFYRCCVFTLRSLCF